MNSRIMAHGGREVYFSGIVKPIFSALSGTTYILFKSSISPKGYMGLISKAIPCKLDEELLSSLCEVFDVGVDGEGDEEVGG